MTDLDDMEMELDMPSVPPTRSYELSCCSPERFQELLAAENKYELALMHLGNVDGEEDTWCPAHTQLCSPATKTPSSL